MHAQCVAGSIIFAVFCAVPPTIAVAATKSLDAQRASTNPLAGVWRFESEVDTRADGSVFATATSKGNHGFIVYTADNFVSAIIMPSKRRWTLESATREQLVASADDGTAYAGRYEIDTRRHIVTHILGVSFEPAYESRRLERKFEVTGDKLAFQNGAGMKRQSVVGKPRA